MAYCQLGSEVMSIYIHIKWQISAGRGCTSLWKMSACMPGEPFQTGL